MERAWINQPSTLQPLHKLHGVRVLAEGTRVYFLSGDVSSMEVPANALSKGWPAQPERAPYYLCRYVRTDEIKEEGRGFSYSPDGSHLLASPRAPSYVYRMRRVSPALHLTKEEATLLDAALCEEGCPHLLHENAAQEGKAL